MRVWAGAERRDWQVHGGTYPSRDPSLGPGTPEGLFQWNAGPTPRVSDSAGLGRGPRICTANHSRKALGLALLDALGQADPSRQAEPRALEHHRAVAVGFPCQHRRLPQAMGADKA